MTQQRDYNYLLKFLTNSNRKRYANNWIAIKDNKIQIKNKNLSVVKKFLEHKRIKDALIYKIPKQQRKF